nr:hypothetical protein [Tanacetum cinerariifolium]
MTSVHISSGLALQRQMASANNTPGFALQRNERCTLQCALSLEEEKSSCLRQFSSTSFMLFHARSVIKWINEIQSHVTHQDSSSEETTVQGFIPSNLDHLNQSFDSLTKLTMNHPLENVIYDPSRSVLTRSQLQGHVIWCYFDANDNPIPLVENCVVEIYYLKGRIMVKRLLIRREAVEASKRRRSLIDHKIQLLSKGSSEGSEVTEKQAGYVQTSLTLSYAKLELQSMVDVPIHQEDPAVQRTLLIETIVSMVTDKTTSTPTPPTTQAHVQLCSTSCWKYISRGVSKCWLVQGKQ